MSQPWLLATANADEAPLILSGVLLSLVVIYLASKLGGELSQLLNLPPVLGELVGGVAIGPQPCTCWFLRKVAQWLLILP